MQVVHNNGDRFFVNPKFVNNNAVVAVDAKVTFTVPTGVTMLSANVPQGSVSGNVWSLGDVPANQTFIGAFEFQVVNISLAPFILSWLVSSRNGDSNQANNTFADIIYDSVCLPTAPVAPALTVRPIDDPSQCLCHFVGDNDIKCPSGSNAIYTVVLGSEINGVVTLDPSTGFAHVIPTDPMLGWSYQYEISCRSCTTNAITGPFGPATVSGPPMFNGAIGSYGAIGGWAWNDLDEDGIQDLNEPPIAGVVVTLTHIGVVGSTILNTDTNGRYVFTNLIPGQYQVGFTTPVGFTPTLPNVGLDIADSDSVSGITVILTLNPGQILLNVDAGFYI